MPLTYATFLTSIANLMPVDFTTNAELLIDFPNIIDDVELRMYRDLDLLNTIVRDASAVLSIGTRTLNLPSTLGTFVVVDQINVLASASGSAVIASADSLTRYSLTPASKELLDVLFPSYNYSAIPVYFAPITQNQFIVGPAPNQAYAVEVVGTIRPAPLSTSNVTTLLSVYFPDVLMAGAMVRVAAYMKNYGAAVDDPQQGVTWETHFNKLLEGAKIEEARKKSISQAWSNKIPAPLATPPRA
jgi:hypothetical protein